MTWTVGRRIALALAIELVLLIVVAFVGGGALGRSAAAYERALAVRRTSVAPAIRTESEVRGANAEQLRYLLTGDERYERRRDSITAVARGLAAAVSDTVRTPDARERWKHAIALLVQWNEAALQASAASKARDQATVLSIRATKLEPLAQSIDSLLRVGILEQQIEGEAEASVGRAAASDARGAITLVAILAIIIGTIAAIFLSRSITRPLQATATGIAASSAQILASTTEQAAGTNESMAAVTETVATVDEVAQTAVQSTQRARAVADAAQRAAEGGRAGRKAVDDAVSAMRLVQVQVEAMATGIVALAEQAQSIGEITTAVSEIAEQTKLLALNAAVESTRAGEHGRGFALVAAEIKTLAGEAKESTVQVRRLLSDIQRSTSAVVMATEQGTKQTAAAVRQVNQAGDVIAQLATVADEAAQAAAQIVASAGQQALGMEQIRQAIANIHDATQQNLTATKQTETAAQDLNSLGTRLVDMVGARKTA